MLVRMADRRPRPQIDKKFAPTRRELKFRLAFSLYGSALVVVALLRAPVMGLAIGEVGLLAGAFFGGTALWASWKLWQRDHPE